MSAVDYRDELWKDKIDEIHDRLDLISHEVQRLKSMQNDIGKWADQVYQWQQETVKFMQDVSENINKLKNNFEVLFNLYKKLKLNAGQRRN